MKALFISNLFPDAENPNRGIYNAELLKHLSALCELRVLAPRPTRGFPPFWFPGRFQSREQDKMFDPIYAPAAYVPRIGSRINHLLMARTIEPALGTIRDVFPFDVVLSSWIYPDTCAISEMAGRKNFPFVAVAQGSDVHQYLGIPARRKIICKALGCASAVVARSHDLARQITDAGIAQNKLRVIYNGVDLERFSPGKRSEVRLELGLPENASILLFVGNFLPIKNPLLLVEAHAALCKAKLKSQVILIMIGTGPLRKAIERKTKTLGTNNLVSLLGAKPSLEVARYMRAADLLCVTSENEGVPNVVLEALACGLRVVARKVGGIPEIMVHDFLGCLVEERNSHAMANAISKLLLAPAETERIAQHARQFSWESTAQDYFELLRSAVESR